MEEAGVRHSLGMWWLGHLCSYPALLVKSPWRLQAVNKFKWAGEQGSAFMGLMRKGAVLGQSTQGKDKNFSFPRS